MLTSVWNSPLVPDFADSLGIKKMLTQYKSLALAFVLNDFVPLLCFFLSSVAAVKSVMFKFKFKTLMFAYRTATGSAPAYFHSLITIYIPSRSLRSASERRLVVPSQRGSKSLSRTFSFTVPGWWNEFPTLIRNAESLTIFKRRLKTHLFRHRLTCWVKCCSLSLTLLSFP